MGLSEFIKHSEGRYIFKKENELYFYKDGNKHSRIVSEDELNSEEVKFHNTRLLKEVK